MDKMMMNLAGRHNGTGLGSAEEETVAVESESGIAALFTSILNMLLSIFGIGGDDEPAPQPEQIAEQLSDVETLLSDLLVETVEDPAPVDDQEEELELML